MSVDAAIQLAVSVSSGNGKTMLALLLPQYHSSTSKQSVIKNRRLVEDKILGRLSLSCYIAATARTCVPRAMDVFEIAINYNDSPHGGDRRKRSQQCSSDTFKLNGFDFGFT